MNTVSGFIYLLGAALLILCRRWISIQGTKKMKRFRPDVDQERYRQGFEWVAASSGFILILALVIASIAGR